MENPRYPRRDVAPVATAVLSATSRVYVNVEQAQNMSVQVSYDNVFAGTIRVYGSLSSTQPDVSTSLSTSNEFFPLSTADFDTDTIIAGTTYYTVTAGAAGIKAFDVQAILAKWICIEVVRTAGTFRTTYMKSNNG